MRTLRIAAPAQLALNLRSAGDESEPEDLWEGLPEATRSGLLGLIARLIARSVIVEEELS